MNKEFSEKVLQWYQNNGRKNLPWKVRDPYKIWISEVMLQQTQVSTVIPYYLKFIQSYPDLTSLSKANLDDLFLLWSGLGYYRRIENIYEASKIISTKYNNKFPRDFDDILSLPGIGKTTASAISTFSGFSNKAILDGNVKRILRRYFDISKVNNSNIERMLWEKSNYVTPMKHTSEFIQGMMDIGSLICTRHNPNCDTCPLKQLNCLYDGDSKKIVKSKKTIKKINMYLAVIINSKDKIYLEKIRSESLWNNLYSSPLFLSKKEFESWMTDKKLRRFKLKYTSKINHRVTNKNFEILSNFYFLKNDKNVSLSSKNWYNLSNINVGIPRYLEKILNRYKADNENSNV